MAPDTPALLLGPLLRHVDPVSATVWVETDRPCEVAVLGRRARTFCVGGHHYALVVVEDLEAGRAKPHHVPPHRTRGWAPAAASFPPRPIRPPRRARPLPVAVCSPPDAPPAPPPVP